MKEAIDHLTAVDPIFNSIIENTIPVIKNVHKDWRL
jgi:hypothetical protein